MKKILIAFTLCLITGTSLVALSNSGGRLERELRAEQAAWQAQTQQLAEIQTETAMLKAKIGERKQELQSRVATTVIDPELAAFLLTNNLKFASSELQDRLLASFGRGGNFSGGYVLVTKAALANANLKPLKNFPDGEKLSDAVRGTLAITAAEQPVVESVFAETYGVIGTWAKQNLQREGPVDAMLAQYVLPTDGAFRESLTKNLYSNLNAAIGAERGELLRKFFEHYGIYEDGAIGARTNILSIHRIAAPPGYGYRSGWREADGSEAINTYPEPIKPKNFPYPFRFVFPGGWQEVAQREGFELPKEFDQH